MRVHLLGFSIWFAACLFLAFSGGASAHTSVHSWAHMDIPVHATGHNHADHFSATYWSWDLLRGMYGNDVLKGLSGHDELQGQGGHDDLFGHAGNDVLRGGYGNDFLHGGPGYDTCIGGPGIDIYRDCEDTR